MRHVFGMIHGNDLKVHLGLRNTVTTYIRIAILITSGLIFTSCVGHQNNKYPESWETIIQPTGACPDIKGKFAAKAENSASGLLLPFWELAFRYERTPGINKATHIVLWQKDERSIEITMFKNGEKIISKTFNFECEGGFLKISSIKPTFDGLNLALARETLYFGLSDGYLVVKSEDKGAGMILLIPLAGSNIDWYRFKEIKD